MRRSAAYASRATLAGLAVHYLCFYLFASPLWTDNIAQWIMARTPSQYALWILGTLGCWAKPFAMTGGLAALGFGVLLIALSRRAWLMPIVAILIAIGYSRWFEYSSVAGQVSFWIPAVLFLELHSILPARNVIPQAGMSRREALVMTAGTLAVAAESYARDRRMSGLAVAAIDIAPFQPPPEVFGLGLVRKAVTPTGEFYGMSKNTVDPAPDARTWRLKLSVDGRSIHSFSYSELLKLPRVSGYSTLRCVSNTLKSDLMGTALWTGVRLQQLIHPDALPPGIVEVAILGADGHGDSLSLDFAFSDGALLALGMNGKALDRTHGFPLRLIAPRYYGFKNVKWISEIAFVRHPYVGTWPKLGYTKEPAVHTGSHIDRVVRAGSRLRVGGVSFAGDRGIGRVQVRADEGPWVEAILEAPLSQSTWRRWMTVIDAPVAAQVQARAMDGGGVWQSDIETPLFPDGVNGPTIR